MRLLPFLRRARVFKFRYLSGKTSTGSARTSMHEVRALLLRVVVDGNRRLRAPEPEIELVGFSRLSQQLGFLHFDESSRVIVIILEEPEQGSQGNIGNKNAPPPVVHGSVRDIERTTLRHDPFHFPNHDFSCFELIRYLGSFFGWQGVLNQKDVLSREFALHFLIRPLKILLPGLYGFWFQLGRNSFHRAGDEYCEDYNHHSLEHHGSGLAQE